LLNALKNIADARGFAALAENAGLSRGAFIEHYQKTEILNMNLTVEPIEQKVS